MLELRPDFVLDSSVTLSWVLPDEQSDYADEVLRLMERSTAVVPRVWPFEVANGLLVGERRAGLTLHEVWRFVDMLKLMAIDIDGRTTIGGPFESLFEIGFKYRLSGYDAAFLELALRHGLPLATLDKDLRRAAAEAGVRLLDLA